LRAKLDDAGWHGGSIGTVWGKGYRMERKED
jgi:DNA-binding response OmpR family regulator